MNWYREYQNEWKEIIETVARELGRSDYAIENGIAIIAESDVFVYKK